ncbi:hypothetical protein ACTFIW_004027 [Dictyostelium discoideum]
MEDKLFFKVWRNVYLFKMILEFKLLYEKNEIVTFLNLKSLIEYENKEYIITLIYKGNEAINEKCFLPNYKNGVLNRIVFKEQSISNIAGCLIPFGVEIIEFGISSTFNNNILVSTTPLFLLPSTIKSVKNVVINETDYCKGNDYLIPNNIKEITFLKCPKISKDTIKFPSTLESITFIHDWNNGDSILKIGDIPNGIKNLILSSYREGIDISVLPHSIINLEVILKGNKLFKNVIPMNVKSLTIMYYNENENENENENNNNKLEITHESLPQSLINLECYSKDMKFLPNSIPSTVEKLQIYDLQIPLTPSILSSSNSIKKFEIAFDLIEFTCKRLNLNFNYYIGSLLQCLTSLIEFSIIGYFNSKIETNILPNGLKIFNLLENINYNQPFDQDNILPSTLTHLILNNNFSIENLLKIKLPISLTFLSLSKNLENNFNINNFNNFNNNKNLKIHFRD